MTDIAGLFRSSDRVEKRAPGDEIFHSGAPGDCMYVVRAGRVAVTLDGETVETVEPGGMVGEMALLDDAPRSATAVALTDCELVPVDRKQFLFRVQQTPFFAIDVMRVMANRLRVMNRRAAPAGSSAA